MVHSTYFCIFGIFLRSQGFFLRNKKKCCTKAFAYLYMKLYAKWKSTQYGNFEIS